MLEVKAIDVFYGNLRVIHKVSLEVKEGEIVAIFGPNGHGKSTLLKAISGLVPLSSGEIVFKGGILNETPAYKIPEKGLIYVSESGNLFPDLTVRENLELGSYNKNASSQRSKNLRRVYQLFPRLKERENQKAITLSGGEKKMLSLGRGLMTSADLMLIDEPSFGLAPNLQNKVYSLINEVNKQGITILIVDQNVSILADIANRIYFLEEGRIVFEGNKKTAFKDKHVRKTFFGY